MGQHLHRRHGGRCSSRPPAGRTAAVAPQQAGRSTTSRAASRHRAAHPCPRARSDVLRGGRDGWGRRQSLEMHGIARVDCGNGGCNRSGRAGVCMCCVSSSHLFWTSGLWTYQPGSHRISPSSFCACLHFSREKDSAVPFPRRP